MSIGNTEGDGNEAFEGKPVPATGNREDGRVRGKKVSAEKWCNGLGPDAFTRVNTEGKREFK
jgi:hypothetical protein